MNIPDYRHEQCGQIRWVRGEGPQKFSCYQTGVAPPFPRHHVADPLRPVCPTVSSRKSLAQLKFKNSTLIGWWDTGRTNQRQNKHILTNQWQNSYILSARVAWQTQRDFPPNSTNLATLGMNLRWFMTFTIQMGPATYPNDLKFLSPGLSGARWYLQIVGPAQAHAQPGQWAHGPARPVTNTGLRPVLVEYKVEKGYRTTVRSCWQPSRSCGNF